MPLPPPTSVLVLTDHALLERIVTVLEANEKLLADAITQLGSTRLYEEDAAAYLKVEKYTMYRYRQKGLPFEKVGRVISYRRSDLDDWRTAGRVQHERVG